MPVPLRLTIPRSLYPPASPLGRAVRRWAHDARQAESVYFVVVALVLCLATLAGQWGWIAFGTTPEGAPSLAFFGVQVVGGLGLAATCLVGWRPPVAVTARDAALDVRQGDRALSLHYGRIASAERITAEAYHRHWRRFAATRAFVNRLPDDLLLLHTASGPVVLGLAPADLDRLQAHLADRLAPAQPSPLVRAA